MLAASAAVVLLGASLFASPVAASGGSWAQFGYAPTRSGYNPGETTLNPGNVGKLKPIWQIDLGAPSSSGPAVVGTRVFITAGDGSVVALDRATGKTLWRTALGTSAGGQAPAVYGSLVIVTGDNSGGGFVAAFNVSSGKLVWRTAIAAPGSTATPAIYGSSVFLASAGTVYDIAAATGKVIWKKVVTTSADGYIDGPVAVSGYGQYVIAAGLDGWVYNLTATKGGIHWKVKAGFGIHRGGPSIYNGIIYVPEGQEQAEGASDLVAIQVSDGNILWRTYDGGDVHITPAAGAGRVFVGEIDDFVRAFDAKTGKLLWQSPISVECFGAPVLANGVLYLGTDMEVEAFNAATGQQLFASGLGTTYASTSSMAVLDGRVYSGSGSGTVHVFGLP